MRHTITSFPVVLSLGCVPEGVIPEALCNGASSLCSRPIDQVAFAATHNSMSSLEREWLPPNHRHAVPTQLRDGIRGLNLDTYLWEREPYLCHGYCELGSQPLQDGLFEIEEFLQEQPDNVILITLQSSISAEDTIGSFVAAGMGDRLYQHATGQPWPTLGELIERENQLVVFGTVGGGELPGYMAQWEHWLDNPYGANYPEDFACIPDRGDADTATLYNVNHFLSRPISHEDFAEEGNNNPVLRDHVFTCFEETGMFPNQILVDFYSIGDIFSVVAELNSLGTEL